MSRMTPTMEQSLFCMKCKCLNDLLQVSVKHFQKGEDAAGLESLLRAVDELENIVENDQKKRQPHIDLDRLLPPVERLHFYMQNQDITGILDLLEYTLCPLTEQWLKGCETT